MPSDVGHPLRYVFLDLVTFDYIGALFLVGVSFGQTVSATDTFGGTFIASNPQAALVSWERCTRPNMAALIVFAGNSNTILWSGMVTTRKRTKTKSTVEVTCATFDQWMTQRLQADDYTMPNGSAAYWAANPADPTSIAAQIVHDALTQSLTMPVPGTLSSEEVNIAGGVVILVNGQPPAQITGGVFLGSVTNTGANGRGFGRNPGVVGGGPGVGSVLSATGVAATVNSVSQIVDAVYVTNGATGSVASVGDNIVRDVETDYPITVGMALNDVLAGGSNWFDPNTTVSAVGTRHNNSPTSRYKYDSVTVTHNSTGSGGWTGGIGGFFNFVMDTAATATESETIDFSAGMGPTPTGFWIDGQYAKTQFQTVEAIIDALAQMAYQTGFDYSWETHIGDDQQPYLVFGIWYPRKGRAFADSNILIDSEWCSEYVYTEDGTSQAFGVIESSTGAGGTIVPPAIAPSIAGAGWMVSETSQSHTQVNDRKQLQAMVDGDLWTSAWPNMQLVVTLPLSLDDADPSLPTPGSQPKFRLSDFRLGDSVLFVISTTARNEGMSIDPLFPNGMSFEWRIMAWKATIADVGTSTVDLTLDIPPDASVPPPRPPLS